MLENQIAQQASSSSKAQGKLPNQPENPREHCKAVILRSGKIVEDEKKDGVEEEKRKKDKDKNESTSNYDEVNEEANRKKEVEKEEEEKYVPPPPYKPPLPYPERRLEDYETVALTEEYSAILQNKLPPKLKDPESFSILCHIGETSIEKALCDLRASVSLMPLSICEKLKVGNFFIPVDFVVLEMEEDVRTPIILRKPFLATAVANIDVKNGKLKLKVGEEEIEFNLFQDSKESVVVNSCYRVDVIENDTGMEDIKLEGNQIALYSQYNQHIVRKKKLLCHFLLIRMKLQE
ncbi:uncharacterized protein LOC131170217 [Hevea brasiliensis]|uniref:uncharacterized protein LOC131170217 n=1 Tax=Hevea brasiliensis TaxID=3981 RepID=UPI0025F7DAF5|nr:uncharacterized protein LOC131170217 [Hevea brasiliensis]